MFQRLLLMVSSTTFSEIIIAVPAMIIDGPKKLLKSKNFVQMSKFMQNNVEIDIAQ